MISYHDVLLREPDLHLLKGPHWLNDQIVAFYYEYLTHEAVAHDAICFLPGAAAYLMRLGEVEEMRVVFSEPLRLDQRAFIFAALNDNPDVTQAEGGSHWSLLIWIRDERVFVHLDSCGGMNNAVATVLAEKIHKLLGIQGSVKLRTPTVPQQQNVSDCALYMLKFTQLLASCTTEWSSANLKVLECVTSAEIALFRREVLELIESKK